MPQMLPAVAHDAVNQVAGAARTGQFARMTEEVYSEGAIDILMRAADAPARRQLTTLAAHSGFEDDTAHQSGTLLFMAGFLPSISPGVLMPRTCYRLLLYWQPSDSSCALFLQLPMPVNAPLTNHKLLSNS